MDFSNSLSLRFARFGLALTSVLVCAVLLDQFVDHVNSTTVALALLICVLFSATFFGRNPALVASFAAMLSFNYFFLPPVRTWTIADPQNLIAWAAFTITAIIAGELSAYARRRAREAQRLYTELEEAFEKAAHTEALEQSEYLKSALLDAVTHDLRTPLTSIKASVTTLLESEGGHRTIELDDENRIEFLEIINEETDRLNGFIESMVELAKLEAGPSGIFAGTSNIEDVVRAALQRAEKVVADHRVRVQIDEDLQSVVGDPRALAEVVYILVENAAKYSPIGSAIDIRSQTANGNTSVSITDEGAGIPADKRESVFEKFVRLDKRSVAGLGLGLAIARRIVDAHKGTIRIESGSNGKGTSVVVSLPAAK